MRTRQSPHCKRGDHLTCQHEGTDCGCACHATIKVRAAPPASKGPSDGWAKARIPTPVRQVLTKEDAPCCVAKRDHLGRLPIGYCSPDCIRRP